MRANPRRHRLTRIAAPRGLLVAGLLLCTTTSVVAADEHLGTAKLQKAAVACQKVLAQASAKVVADKLKALDGCANAALTCVQTKQDDPDCLGKAGGTCLKHLDKAALALTRARGKIVAAKSCAAELRLPDLLGSDGLGLGDLAGACQTDFALDVCTGVETLAACALGIRDRAAGAIYGEARPRTSELLTALPNVTLPPIPGLPPFAGCGPCGAPEASRKAVEQCGKVLTKARLALGAALEKTLAGCVQNVLACVQTKGDDAKCLPKATTRCDKATGKIDAALAKFASAVAKKCAASAVDFAALGADSGLGLAALAADCTNAPTDMAGVAECLQARGACTTAELVRNAIGRVGAFAESGHLGTLATNLTATCPALPSSTTGPAAVAPRVVFGSIAQFLKQVRRPAYEPGVRVSGGRPNPSPGAGRGITRASGPPRVGVGSTGKFQIRYRRGARARNTRATEPATLIVAIQRADVALDDHFEVVLDPPPGAGNVDEVDDEIEVTYEDTIPGCAFSLALATRIDGVLSEYTPLLQVVDTVPLPTPTISTPTPTITATPPPFTVTRILDATGDGGGNTLGDAVAIASDVDGNLIVAGATTDNAFKRTPAGTITEILDATGDGIHPLNFPAAVAIDESGNAYVASAAAMPDTNAFKIAAGGGITQIIDSTGDDVHLFSAAGGIAVDSASTVYVSGALTGNVFKITSGGTITQIIDTTGDGVHMLSQPLGVAVHDATGDVFVAGGQSDNVFKITSTGTITQIIDASGDGVHALDAPVDVAVDGSGNVYVVGSASNNAFKITSGGTITQIIDVTGSGVGNPFAQPVGVATRGTDVYVIGGASNRRGFKIAEDGAITLIIDPFGDGQGNVLQLPSDIAADGFGNVYVADRVSQVFMISP